MFTLVAYEVDKLLPKACNKEQEAQTRIELAIFGLRDRRLTTWPLRRGARA